MKNRDTILLVSLFLLTSIALVASIFSLQSGYLIIFQNLFYFPIIFACIFYRRRGVIFSLFLSCLYYILVQFFSNDPEILSGALIRVFLFVFIAYFTFYIIGKTEEKELRFQAIFESSKDALMVLEPPAWGFSSGNSSALKMFMAKDENEFSSADPWSYSPEKQPDGRLSREKAKELIEIAMAEGSKSFEWTHRRLNGEEFPASVLLTRINVEGKKFIQATVRDMTEQRKLENELKDKYQETEKLNNVLLERESKMIELKKEVEDLKKK